MTNLKSEEKKEIERLKHKIRYFQRLKRHDYKTSGSQFEKAIKDVKDKIDKILSKTNPQFVHTRLKKPGYFDKRSFRTIRRKGHDVIVGCQKGKYSVSIGRCKVGTEAQAILHPLKENPKRCRMKNLTRPKEKLESKLRGLSQHAQRLLREIDYHRRAKRFDKESKAQKEFNKVLKQSEQIHRRLQKNPGGEILLINRRKKRSYQKEALLLKRKRKGVTPRRKRKVTLLKRKNPFLQTAEYAMELDDVIKRLKLLPKKTQKRILSKSNAKLARRNGKSYYRIKNIPKFIKAVGKNPQMSKEDYKLLKQMVKEDNRLYNKRMTGQITHDDYKTKLDQLRKKQMAIYAKYKSNPSIKVEGVDYKVVGEIPGRIKEIKYDRFGDTKHEGKYYHKFESPSKMLALDDGSLVIVPESEKKLWEKI